MTELKKVPIKVAAAILGKSEQFVRCELQYQRLNFGTAVTTNPDKKPRQYYTYYISPKKFIEYTGCTAADLLDVYEESEKFEMPCNCCKDTKQKKILNKLTEKMKISELFPAVILRLN